jgi:hypothetical protein
MYLKCNVHIHNNVIIYFSFLQNMYSNLKFILCVLNLSIALLHTINNDEMM